MKNYLHMKKMNITYIKNEYTYIFTDSSHLSVADI